MLRKLLGLAGATALALTLNMPGASALGPDITGTVFEGEATVTGGLWFPVVGPEVTTGWSFSSTIGVPFSVDGSGSVTGFCGRSTGSGSANIRGSLVKNQTASFEITWQSAGGTIIIAGSSNGWTGAAVVQARPLPSVQGAVPCATEAAVKFTVAGIAGAVKPGV